MIYQQENIVTTLSIFASFRYICTSSHLRCSFLRLQVQLENIQRVRQGHCGYTSDYRQLCIHALLNLLEGLTSAIYTIPSRPPIPFNAIGSYKQVTYVTQVFNMVNL